MRRKGTTLVEVIIVCALIALLLGSAMGAFTQLLAASRFTDNLMEADFQSQNAINNISLDLRCSSHNTSGDYYPRVNGSELRFKVVNGFSMADEKATYTSYWVCYWYDTAGDRLVRRFRNDAGQLLTAAPAEFPGEAEQTVASNVTSVSWNVDSDTGLVFVSIKTAVGDANEVRSYAELTKSAYVLPQNMD